MEGMLWPPAPSLLLPCRTACAPLDLGKGQAAPVPAGRPPPQHPWVLRVLGTASGWSCMGTARAAAVPSWSHSPGKGLADLYSSALPRAGSQACSYLMSSFAEWQWLSMAQGGCLQLRLTQDVLQMPRHGNQRDQERLAWAESMEPKSRLKPHY